MLEKHIQVISSDLMQALRESATEHGISLDMEIALRLMAHMAEPDLTEDQSLFSKIRRMHFTEQEMFAENKRRHLGDRYLFEIEQLRNFLRFEKSLPKSLKLPYTLIDVKTETLRIKAEFEAEDKKNRE